MGTRSRSALTALFAVLALGLTVPDATVGAEPDTTSAPVAEPAVTAPPTANPAQLSVTLVAHRAAAGGAPEQTAAAMERAVAMRPDHIEVDVQLSKDDVPVLVHDRTFARTTDVAAVFPGREHDPIGSFTLREIRRLDAGSWFAERFAGQRIPTLASVVEQLDGTGVGLFLELKNPADSPGLAAAVAKVLDADYRWRGVELTFLSFDAAALRRMAVQHPGPRLLWLSSEVPGAATLAATADWAAELGADHRRLSAAAVSRAHAAGLSVAAYTVNTDADQARAVSLGIDTLVTDHPERFLDG